MRSTRTESALIPLHRLWLSLSELSLKSPQVGFSHGLPPTVHSFTLRPYSFSIITKERINSLRQVSNGPRWLEVCLISTNELWASTKELRANNFQTIRSMHVFDRRKNMKPIRTLASLQKRESLPLNLSPASTHADKASAITSIRSIIVDFCLTSLAIVATAASTERAQRDDGSCSRWMSTGPFGAQPSRRS